MLTPRALQQAARTTTQTGRARRIAISARMVTTEPVTTYTTGSAEPELAQGFTFLTK
jgi:hypothetical protein